MVVGLSASLLSSKDTHLAFTGILIPCLFSTHLTYRRLVAGLGLSSDSSRPARWKNGSGLRCTYLSS